jgi:hypothetical protein
MTSTYNFEQYKMVVDHLQQAVEPINRSPPVIDLSKDISTYCETLRFTPPEQRQAKLTAFVRPKAEQALSHWRTEVMHGHELLIELHNTIEQIQADKGHAETAIAAARGRVGPEELRRDRLRERDAKLKKELADVRPATSFSRWSYRLLIVGSLLIGLVTAWYYLNMQVSIQAAKHGFSISPAGEAAAGNYSSTIDYLQANPTDWIYAFGVVVFLLAGKIISVIHARLRHPAWLFIVVSLVAVGMTIGTVFLLGSVASLQQDLQHIEKQIQDANPPGLMQVNCSLLPSTPICLKISEMTVSKAPITAELAGRSFWMTVLVLLAEILLGAVAWMLASEHHEKHGVERDAMLQRIAANSDEVGTIEKRIADLQQTVTDQEASRGRADMLIQRLKLIQPKIPSETFVHEQCEAVLRELIQQSQVILAEWQHRWALTDAVPRSG